MAPLKPPRKKKLILKILEFYLKKRQNESFSGAHIWESCSPLSYVIMVKSTVEILQNFVAFSEYMNFKCQIDNEAFLENTSFKPGF